jgi:hypothetical protein
MANTVTELRRLPGLRHVVVQGTIVLSGSYATGGETLGFIKPGTTKSPYNVAFYSKSGNFFVWDHTTDKMKAFSAAGTELTAGAYAAGYTGDVIRYEASYPKFG